MCVALPAKVPQDELANHTAPANSRPTFRYQSHEVPDRRTVCRRHASGLVIRERTQAGLAACAARWAHRSRRRNSPVRTSRLPRRCSPTPTSASPKSSTALVSLPRRSIVTSPPREPRILRAADTGLSTPTTGRSGRVFSWRRAAAQRRQSHSRCRHRLAQFDPKRSSCRFIAREACRSVPNSGEWLGVGPYGNVFDIFDLNQVQDFASV